MIPDFDKDGYLPEGIYTVTLDYITERFNTSKRRSELIDGIRKLISICQELRVKSLYIDGSFVSNKLEPNDFDACYELPLTERKMILEGMLTSRSILLLSKDAQKKEFKGEVYDAFSIADSEETSYKDYFQKRKEDCHKRKLNRRKKGIIKIEL